MVALIEMWLKGEEEITVEGYRWFGRNRWRLHSRAVRGSGGVGLLVHEEVLKCCEVEVLDTDVEDMLWMQPNKDNGEALTLAVCYTPPESSSREGGAEEALHTATGRTGGKFGSLADSYTNLWRL